MWDIVRTRQGGRVGKVSSPEGASSVARVCWWFIQEQLHNLTSGFANIRPLSRQHDESIQPALPPRSEWRWNLSKRLNPYHCIFRKETASNKQFHFCGNLTWNNIKLVHNMEVSILQSARMAHKGFYAGLLCFWGMHCLFLKSFHWGISRVPLKNITVRFNIIYRTRWFKQ